MKNKNLGIDSYFLLAKNIFTRFIFCRRFYQFKNSILMEIEDNNNHIDRILINRQKPSDYTYERAVITPYGSASGKTYNSQKDNDSKIETRVNDYITKYFDKVLTNDDGTSKLTKKYHR